MELHLNLPRRGTMALALARQLEEAILDGRLASGQALPATRELASRLAVSRNTVLAAYERLTAEGFLESRVGAGTFVASGFEKRLERSSPRAVALAPLPRWRRLPAPSPPETRAPYDFRIGVPDATLFPWPLWRSALARELRGRVVERDYPPPQGEPALRAAIARHYGTARSLRASAEDVLVTSGAQQAFDLIGRVLLAPGSLVAVEDPGYPQVRRALAATGARVVPVPVDREGLVVEAIPRAARLVYVTPSHQFPLGVAMSLPRRLALLDWASRRGAAIIEDDYDSELRFDGRPLEPLQSLDHAGCVLYVGTFSKVLLPSLRLGFVVAPGPLVHALRAAKETADGATAVATQRALASLLADGTLARHVRGLIRRYRRRREALQAALARHLGARAEVLPSAAGLHLSLRLRGRLELNMALARALAAGVAVQPLAPYSLQSRGRAGLALGYGLIDERAIDEGVRRLASALR